MSQLSRKTPLRARKGLVRSAFVRHTPFEPQNGLKRRKVAQVEKGAENALDAPVAQKNGNSTLRKVGKKGQEWITARNWLRKRFNWAGITSCEFKFQGCWGDQWLSFAHCKKRRKLEDGEIWHVGLACQHCHSILDEVMNHEEMHTAVHRVIHQRGLIAPPQ